MDLGDYPGDFTRSPVSKVLSSQKYEYLVNYINGVYHHLAWLKCCDIY